MTKAVAETLGTASGAGLLATGQIPTFSLTNSGTLTNG
jgi:hypothetical protein